MIQEISKIYRDKADEYEALLLRLKRKHLIISVLNALAGDLSSFDGGNNWKE